VISAGNSAHVISARNSAHLISVRNSAHLISARKSAHLISARGSLHVICACLFQTFAIVSPLSLSIISNSDIYTSMFAKPNDVIRYLIITRMHIVQYRTFLVFSCDPSPKK